MERCACSFLAAATTQARAVCSDRCSDHIAFPEPTAIDGSVGGHATTATSWPSDWPSSSIQCGIVRVHAATYGFATNWTGYRPAIPRLRPSYASGSHEHAWRATTPDADSAWPSTHGANAQPAPPSNGPAESVCRATSCYDASSIFTKRSGGYRTSSPQRTSRNGATTLHDTSGWWIWCASSCLDARRSLQTRFPVPSWRSLPHSTELAACV